MMLLCLVLLATDTTDQSAVGDTLWAERTLRLPAGVMVRPRPLRVSEPLQALGPPEAVLQADSVRLRYPLVAWEPGRHAVSVPGAILIREDGWSDTLPDWRVTVDVASVLPDLPRDSLAPREAAPALPQATRRPRAVGMALALALVVLLPLHRAWGHRRPITPRTRPRPYRPDAALLRRWAGQGEPNAALEGWRCRLQDVPGGEAVRLSEEIAASRFGPHDPALAAGLMARADALERGRT